MVSCGVDGESDHVHRITQTKLEQNGGGDLRLSEENRAAMHIEMDSCFRPSLRSVNYVYVLLDVARAHLRTELLLYRRRLIANCQLDIPSCFKGNNGFMLHHYQRITSPHERRRRTLPQVE